MPAIPDREIAWPDARGRVRIRACCSPEEIHACSLDRQFGIHAQFKSLYTRRESLEYIAAHPDANVVLAISDNRHIVGFGVLAPPDSGERWARLGPGIMLEIKAIEVCRRWRGKRIASGLVRMMLAHPEIEKRIVYLVGYSWTWDLEGTGLNAQQYRHMLIRLFEPYGFKEYPTNEPNICLKAENVFMARIGADIEQATRNRFKWLCFGILPGDG